MKKQDSSWHPIIAKLSFFGVPLAHTTHLVLKGSMCLLLISGMSGFHQAFAREKKVNPREQLELRAKDNSEGEFHLFSPHALLMDADTGEVLFEKQADELMDPSSMSKIMTVYMVFDKLKRGELSLDTRLPVSEKAWRMQGSKTFVELGADIRVEDLLRGIIVQSGNDACIVVAEGLSGSEAAFAQKMNDKAIELGAQHTHLTNATGWAEPGIKCQLEIWPLLPAEPFKIFQSIILTIMKQSLFITESSKGIRNPLLYASMGADGLKTGHTEEGGYGLVASVVQDGRRLLLVTNGAKSIYERERDAKILTGWGLREFKNVTLARPHEPLGVAPLRGGALKEVPIVSSQPISVTVRADKVQELKKEIVLKSDLKAPLVKGQEIGELHVILPDGTAKAWPLVTPVEVASLSWWGQVVSSIKSFF